MTASLSKITEMTFYFNLFNTFTIGALIRLKMEDFRYHILKQ